MDYKRVRCCDAPPARLAVSRLLRPILVHSPRWRSTEGLNRCLNCNVAVPRGGFRQGPVKVGIKKLLGQGGPGAPGVLESWQDLIQGTNDQLTNPVGTAIDEVKGALNSPSAAYYLGGKAADGAVAAPGVIFGGEGALVARAGALDDLAAAGAIPHELVDLPSGDHPSLIGGLAGIAQEIVGINT